MNPPEEISPSRVHCRHCGDLHPPSFSHCPKTGRSLTAGRALVGRVIADRYRVLAVIGEGGMGAVYVAEHLMLGRKVALKRLHPELASDEKAVARFQREARAAAATGHEHIVEVLDLGYAEDGAPFLVMEYLRGQSFSKLIQTDAPLAPERACRLLGQALAALDAVHRRGIVHRDLKPDNIILTRRRGDPEFVKVLDFGISKMRPEEGEQTLDLTRTGVMLGTPFYMSPEQARGMKTLDHRVDLFAAGVILYESLTGRLPFDGENYHQLLQAILSGRHSDVRELRPDLDEGLGGVVEKAIAVDREDRYASARDMLLALVPYGAVDPGPTEENEARRVGVAGWPSMPTPLSQTTPMTERLSEPGSAVTPLPTTATPTPDEVSEPALDAARAPTHPMATKGARWTARQPRVGERRTPSPRGLAPGPDRLAAAPRRFAAQSADWRTNGEAAAVAASGARERPEPYRAAPAFATSRWLEESNGVAPRPGRQTAPDAPSGATRVKASLALSAIDEIRSRGADALESVLARLSPEVAARLCGVLLPMAWIELADYVELLREAERAIGRGDGTLAVQLGRATAERELPTTHRLFMQTATPQMAVERIGQIFHLYHSGGHATVRRATAGGYRIETDGIVPDALPHALALSGFYQRMLELAGGRDARAVVVACRERGDEATVTAIRWR